MKKFQFSLDTVLDYKQQVLEGLQNEHAQRVQRVRAQEQHLDELHRSYQSCNQEFREAEAVGITVADALGYEHALRYWESEITQGTALLKQYQREAEEKRLEVVAARQDTASLEKLRERKQEAYRHEVQKSEELLIEELVASKRAVAS